MSLFVYKPHVVGSKDDITSPDVVIDHVWVDGQLRSVNALTSETYLQAEPGETARPAYAVIALGGGALIGPAAVLGSGGICVARKAWRMQNLGAHLDDVTLNGVRLGDLNAPAELIRRAGGERDCLPRGFALIATMKEATGPVDETAALNVEMADAARGRHLSHRLHLIPAARDRWQSARPRPRYSVGPMLSEVTHYL